MERYSLHDSLLVYPKQSEEQKNESHLYVYFTLFFVVNGTGHYRVKEEKTTFVKGDILFFSGEDNFFIEQSEHSQITVFKFTDNRSSKKVSFSEKILWLQRIEQIINCPDRAVGTIFQNIDDKKIIWNFFRLIIEEFSNGKAIISNIHL